MTVITTSAALLIGISGGTSVFAKIIEANHQKDKTYSAQEFYDGKHKSKGFLKDLVRDEKGYSMPRLQMFIFTLIAGVFFVANVVRFLQLPEFSDGMLLLMGVSSSTYAGVKYGENTGDKKQTVSPDSEKGNNK